MNNLAATIAAERGQLEVLQLLLAAPGFNWAAGAYGALIRASKMNHPECISFILGSGWHTGSHNLSDCLVTACKKNNVDAVRALLADPRVDPNSNVRSGVRPGPGPLLLTKACQSGHKELAMLLLADPRTRTHPDALVAAVESGNLELVEAVLQHRLDQPLLLKDRVVQRVYETALD